MSIIFCQIGRGRVVCAFQAVAGAGFDWKFSEEAVGGGILMRMMSMVVSIGGMLITALLLGIVSGQRPFPTTGGQLSSPCLNCLCHRASP